MKLNIDPYKTPTKDSNRTNLVTSIACILASFWLSASAQEINHVQNRVYGEDSLEQRRLNFGEFDI